MVGGDLRAALDRGRRPLPTDPAFSMASAAALAYVALLAEDSPMMARAIEWSSLGSLPLLGYLVPFTTGCAALLEGRGADAADLLEEFWDQAVNVPVWRVMAAPVVVRALVATGRLRAAEDLVVREYALSSDMERAPNLTVAMHLARGQLALTHDQFDAAARAGAAHAHRADRRTSPRRG